METCICSFDECDARKKKRQSNPVSFDFSAYGLGDYDPFGARTDPTATVGSSVGGSFGSGIGPGASFSILQGGTYSTVQQQNSIWVAPIYGDSSATGVVGYTEVSFQLKGRRNNL